MSIAAQIQARIEELEEMKTARCGFDGKPKYGYAANVAMISEEIRRLNRKLEEAHNDDGS